MLLAPGPLVRGAASSNTSAVSAHSVATTAAHQYGEVANSISRVETRSLGENPTPQNLEELQLKQVLRKRKLAGINEQATKAWLRQMRTEHQKTMHYLHAFTTVQEPGDFNSLERFNGLKMRAFERAFGQTITPIRACLILVSGRFHFS